MNDEDFKRLVEPLCMLTGYCRSAGDLTPDGNIEKWAERLIERAKALDKAWDEVSKVSESNDGKTS